MKNKDVDSICDAINAIISDSNFTQQKIENGVRLMAAYSWDNVAGSFIKHFR